MKLIYVDDERGAHVNFAFHIKERTEVSEVTYFKDCKSPIDYVKKNYVDCAFLDIEFPDGNGIELGRQLKELQPNIELVFVTSHDDFAREAYKVGGRGYLTKPYGAEELDEIVIRLKRMVDMPNFQKGTIRSLSKEDIAIYAKTFGNFDLLLNGHPVHFKNNKAKELLAFLIDQMGSTVSSAQIFFALWEQQEYTKSTSTYVRRTLRALKDELEQLGISHIIVSKRNSTCIDMTVVSCDYYDLLQGDLSIIQQYNGKYMSQYSWGEETIPVIERVVAAMEKEGLTPPPIHSHLEDLYRDTERV